MNILFSKMDISRVRKMTVNIPEFDIYLSTCIPDLDNNTVTLVGKMANYADLETLITNAVYRCENSTNIEKINYLGFYVTSDFNVFLVRN